MADRPDTPLTRIEFRITRLCNLACWFCSTSETAENLMPDPGETLRRIDRLEAHPALSVALTGGEPTLNPHLLRFLAAIRRRGLPQVIIETNALRLAYREYLARLLDMHPQIAFLVSLHAHEGEVSDAITRRPGAFGITVAGLENLLAAGCEVHLNHVICSANASRVPEFSSFVARALPGVAEVVFSVVAPVSRARRNPWVFPRLSAVAPPLHQGIDILIQRGIRVTVADRCGLPLCFLRGYESHAAAFAATVAEETPGGVSSRDHTKGPRCEACIWNARCSGVWREYPSATLDLNPVMEVP